MQQRKFVVPEVVIGDNVISLIGRYLGHFDPTLVEFFLDII